MDKNRVHVLSNIYMFILCINVFYNNNNIKAMIFFKFSNMKYILRCFDVYYGLMSIEFYHPFNLYRYGNYIKD